MSASGAGWLPAHMLFKSSRLDLTDLGLCAWQSVQTSNQSTLPTTTLYFIERYKEQNKFIIYIFKQRYKRDEETYDEGMHIYRIVYYTFKCLALHIALS